MKQEKMMTKRTRRLQFSTKEKKKVYERDNGQCIFCGMHYHMECTYTMLYDIKDVMHYINKSAGGLGIEQNGVLGCRYHHNLLDNGNKGLRIEMLAIMETYLRQQYKDWNKESLIYRKYS